MQYKIDNVDALQERMKELRGNRGRFGLWN